MRLEQIQQDADWIASESLKSRGQVNLETIRVKATAISEAVALLIAQPEPEPEPPPPPDPEPEPEPPPPPPPPPDPDPEPPPPPPPPPPDPDPDPPPPPPPPPEEGDEIIGLNNPWFPTTAPVPTGGLTPANLTYLGAVRVPQKITSSGKYPRETFSYGGTVAAIRPGTNRLFLGGHNTDKLVAEVALPEPVKSDTWADLPVAGIVQPFSEITEWRFEQVQRPFLGGLMVDGDRLLWTVYNGYQTQETLLSHGYSSLDLSAPNAQGLWGLVGFERTPGVVNGYMTPVPPAWRDRLAPALTGHSGRAIIATGSTGPGVVGFDPQDLGTTARVPAEGYAYYPHQPATQYADHWNRKHVSAGAAFVGDTVMVVGYWMRGYAWYGTPTEYRIADPVTKANIYLPLPDFVQPDPCFGAKGNHAEGIDGVIWFYSAHDLLRVKQGHLKPWEVRPYLTHALRDHATMRDTERPCTRFEAATYDPERKRLYIIQYGVDRIGVSRLPLIHVYQISA